MVVSGKEKGKGMLGNFCGGAVLITPFWHFPFALFPQPEVAL